MFSDFLLFVVVGFAAQIVDGAIGMAYGLISTTVLLSMAVLPATASASVHAAEVFTAGASALSHWRYSCAHPAVNGQGGFRASAVVEIHNYARCR